MIPKDKSAQNYNQAPASLAAQMSNTSNSIARENPEAETEQPVKKAAKTQKNGEQINIIVPQQTKTRWKVLFAKNNVKMTQGIIFAIEHLIQEIDNGEVELTVGGVIRKKSPRQD